MASRWIMTESGVVQINRNHISAIYIKERLRADHCIYTVCAQIRNETYNLKTFYIKDEAKAWMREIFRPRTKEDKV